MSETTDAQRLLARGSTIELADGATHEIRFSARALARIEDDYGSLDAFAQALPAKPFRTVAYVLHLTLGLPRERALDLVDTRRVAAYIAAIGAALEEALPEQETGDAAGNGAAAPESASPGAGSSTPPWSAGASTRSASGT